MKIAIVGNREGWKYEDIEKVLTGAILCSPICKSDTIISGGADGVDAFAQEFAKKHGNEIIIIYPDPIKPSPQRYYERNEKIASECDFMVVFNKGNNPRSGSHNAMSQAEKLGKEVVVIAE